MFITLITDENKSKIQELVPDAEGVYKVELAWRYILKPGLVLDTILQEAGLTYIRRPPGEFYELWRLSAYEKNYQRLYLGEFIDLGDDVIPT